MARELGATDTATKAEAYGADICIECVGTNDAVRSAIGSVRKGGAVTLVGNVNPTVEIPLQAVVSQQIRLQGSCASCGEYPAAIDLMARGVIRVDALISAVAPLSEGAAWFDKLYRREGNLIKVILQP
jgi:threonine dehydrogenase-like Zn-dependent dehydrogenase